MNINKPLIITLLLLPNVSCAQTGQVGTQQAQQMGQAKTKPSAAPPARRKNIYADPQNLQVLADDISSSQLRDMMKSFSIGLGLRCQSCHVGQEGQSLSTFDFASDQRAMKQKARLMIKMVQQINDDHVRQLDQIDQEDRLMVRCVTCHRGQSKPALIEDVLDQQLAEHDVATAVRKYEQLRHEFHGSHSYDFSELVLPMYVESLASSAQIEAAITFAELNAKYFPESYYTQFVLGQLHRSAGNADQAIKHLQRALTINPAAASMLQPVIESLSGG